MESDEERRGGRGAAVLLACVLLAAAACGGPAGEEESMDGMAEELVRLALAVGEHDPDYVDAYLGPEAWREAVRRDPPTLERIAVEAGELGIRLDRLAVDGEEQVVRRRWRHLVATVAALDARVAQLRGRRFTFDEESRALYGAVAPHHAAEHFEELLAALDAELPGEGEVAERWEALRRRHLVPEERLDAVFEAAIEACRERTLRHLELPEEERFTIEYVRDKPWSGYNWYRGGYESLIQVNTDLPIAIDRAVDLACHEGYPGHHVYNVIVERDLVRGRGWVELTVYPLFSPRSLIAEGSANFGIEVAFPGEERLAFEREVLYPLAGLEPATAARYDAARRRVEQLSYAGNEAARRYLDGEIGRDEAVEWLERYALMPTARAEQRVRFIERYRSYVINYNLGEDLVRGWVEAQGGAAGRPVARWDAFARLLSQPFLPAELAAPGE